MAQCEVCGNEVVQGRGRARRTCSAACRQKAHRQRQAQQVAELRAVATGPALRLAPPVAPADDSPAGRIRAAGAELAKLIDLAAWRASTGWSSHEVNAQFSIASAAEDNAAVIRMVAEEVVAAVLASAPEASRNEPESGTAPADTTAHAGLSRDEPTVAVPAPVTPEGPVADAGPSRDKPAVKAATPARRKRLTQKAARAVADRSHLVRDERHEGWLLRDEETGTVLGHVEPSYGGTSVSGRNGWTYRVDGSFARTGPYKTRDKAAVQCALSWMRMATAPVRNTITGD